MVISYVLGFLLMFGYIVYISLINRKILDSISATIYTLNDDKKWIYTIVLFLTSLLISPLLFELMALNNHTFLAFLTISGLVGIAVNPLICDEKNLTHYIFAFIMGVASQLIVYLMCPIMLLLWIPYIIYTLFEKYSKHNMFWAEMVMMISLLIACLVS